MFYIRVLLFFAANPYAASPAKVYWRLVSQSCEVAPVLVDLHELYTADIKVFQCGGVSIEYFCDNCFGHNFLFRPIQNIHSEPPLGEDIKVKSAA